MVGQAGGHASGPAMSSLPPPPSPPPAVPPPSVPSPGVYYGPPPTFGNYTSWGSRVASALLNGLVSLAFTLPGFVVIITGAAASSSALAIVGMLLMMAGIVVYWVQYCRKLGSTGQAWGQKAMGYKVVDKTTRQPIGAGKAFGRLLLQHFVDGSVLIGYLWPLWDADSQTWSDKIMNTVAVRV